MIRNKAAAVAKPIPVFTFVFAAYAFASLHRECKSEPEANRPRFAGRRSMKDSGSTENGQTGTFEHSEKAKSKKDGDCQMTPPGPSEHE
jgi:hypothetical protein